MGFSAPSTLQRKAGGFKACSTEKLPFYGKRSRIYSDQFKIVTKHQNTKVPEDIVCKKSFILDLKAVPHHLYKGMYFLPEIYAMHSIFQQEVLCVVQLDLGRRSETGEP